jgi:hypothetical protein
VLHRYCSYYLSFNFLCTSLVLLFVALNELMSTGKLSLFIEKEVNNELKNFTRGIEYSDVGNMNTKMNHITDYRYTMRIIKQCQYFFHR